MMRRPAQPASGNYVLGVPLVRSARVTLAGGRHLSVQPGGRGSTLDGHTVERAALAHAALVQGGVLRLGVAQ